MAIDMKTLKNQEARGVVCDLLNGTSVLAFWRSPPSRTTKRFYYSFGIGDIDGATRTFASIYYRDMAVRDFLGSEIRIDSENWCLIPVLDLSLIHI